MRLRHQSLATVANHLFERQANQLLAVGVLVFIFNMPLERVSEYCSGLSGEAKARYCTKVCGVGWKLDSYVMPDELWMKQPDRVPNVILLKTSPLKPYN